MMYKHPKNKNKEFLIAKYHENNMFDSKKPVGGVCKSQDWSNKKTIAKTYFLFEI